MLTLLALLTALHPACSSDSGSTATDSSGDIGSDSDATSDPTADPTVDPDATDITGDPDATGDVATDVPTDSAGDLIDDSSDLGGTSLENIALTWEDPLRLCSASAAVTLRAALADKAIVELAPSARVDLALSSLQAAGLAGAHVERSPFAEAQWTLSNDGVATTLRRYELSGPAASPRLEVTLEHDLGAAGLVLERLDVTRSAGDESAVVYGAAGGEVSFAYRPAGSATSVSLRECEPDATLEEGVDVVVLTSSERVLTLIRFFGTTPPGAVEPRFEWRAARVVEPNAFFFFGDPEEVDFWALTRTFDPDSGAESAQLDRARSATGYYTVFGPWAREGALPFETELAELRLEGLGTDEVAARAVLLGPDSAALVTEVMSPNGPFRRVDRAHLSRLPEADCEGANVFAFGEGSYELQAVTCASGGPAGFDLAAVVPVSFQSDPAIVGQVLTGEAISPVTVDARPGFRIAWGDFEVDLTAHESEGAWFFDVRDGAEPLVESLTFEHDLGVYLAREERLAFANDEAGVSALLVRRWAAQGVGESAIYAPVSFTLAFDEQSRRVTALDRFEYTNTHHNWNDTLAAETDALRLNWAYTFFPGPAAYTVWAETLEGASVLEATEVALTSAGE